MESAEVKEDNEDKGDAEKEEDKAVSGRERLMNAVESAARYPANKVAGEEVAEARASKEEETVRRGAEKREDESTSVNEEEIEAKNVDNWVEIDPSELNDKSTELECWKVARRKSWMDRDAPARYSANKVDGEEVAEARAFKEEETVSREADVEAREVEEDIEVRYVVS